ncbi:glycoside hydrolase family 43 protein [Hypoxylon sp. FL1284]|nr:glycoside hydrolase family 43 protein [Hypoxylon sp. FL1284]
MKLRSLLVAGLALLAPTASSSQALENSTTTYYNPVLSGWHSDPSCTQVNGTFFCATSTFITFPGLPIYASRDLINWKLASHAWNRESQLPGLSRRTTGQQDGMYAPTLRYRDGVFLVICEYLLASATTGVVFRSRDPFRDAAWADPVVFAPDRIDPDLFWDDDDDGRTYAATQGVALQELDLATGALSQPPASLWNGTGGEWPEGPHLYARDGWRYLLIAEGGTALGHSVTMARAWNVTGPYEPCERNPVLTNRGTGEYFQTVGHADLFRDADGAWWGVALATRSGPAFETYPMGRETVLFPVTWDEGEWPVMQPVRGRMELDGLGRALPPPDRDGVPGDGPFNADPDVYDFDTEGANLPRNLIHWRVPRPDAFAITAAAGLRVVPSRNNLTGVPLSDATTPELTGQRGLSFVGRRQTDTLFVFSVDLTFRPREVGQEAGVTVFLTQVNHIDLGVALLPPQQSNDSNSPCQIGATSQLMVWFRAEGTGTPPAPRTVPVPADWLDGDKGGIRLQIEAANATHYLLSAMPAADPKAQVLVGVAPAALVSGGNGSFVGGLVGVYATCNGAGAGDECPEGGDAYFKRWRYTGKGQYISETTVV